MAEVISGTNPYSLSGKVAIVTGAGSGMGRAHAELLAQRGAYVVVQELLAERAEAVAAGIRSAGGAGEALAGDASDVAMMRERVGSIEKRVGHIDIVVNNAGISGSGLAFEAVDAEAFDRMMAVHARSAFFFTQFAVPGMKARQWGRIINISSMFAMKGSPSMSHYTMAKGAMLGLTKALAVELAPWRITVNAIAPGFVETEMTTKAVRSERAEFARRASLVPMQRLALPREVAGSVAFLCTEDAAMLTGQTISPSGGEVIVGF